VNITTFKKCTKSIYCETMWQKESKGKNALYVNLCSVTGGGRNLDTIYRCCSGSNWWSFQL